MARKVYHVVPDGDKWAVKLAGVTQSSHYTKAAAIEAAQKLAHANEPSQVVVHLANGQIETEWTYGDDPFPPPG